MALWIRWQRILLATHHYWSTQVEQLLDLSGFSRNILLILLSTYQLLVTWITNLIVVYRLC